MRASLSALAAAAVLAALVLLAPAQAQAPARASAAASVASGDLGDVAAASVRDDGRDAAEGSASRSGMEIISGADERARVARRRARPRVGAGDRDRRDAVRRARDRRPRDAHARGPRPASSTTAGA